MIFGFSYIKIAIMVAVLAAVSYAGLSIYKAGKDSVYDKLKDQRIEILKDGKAIDEKALAADDDELVCMLVDCSVSDDKP